MTVTMSRSWFYSLMVQRADASSFMAEVCPSKGSLKTMAPWQDMVRFSRLHTSETKSGVSSKLNLGFLISQWIAEMRSNFSGAGRTTPKKSSFWVLAMLLNRNSEPSWNLYLASGPQVYIYKWIYLMALFNACVSDSLGDCFLLMPARSIMALKALKPRSWHSVMGPATLSYSAPMNLSTSV